MWRDTLLLDRPVEHRSRPVSGVGRKPLRLETEALLRSLDDSCFKDGVDKFWQPTGSTVRIAGGSATSAEGFADEYQMARPKRFELLPPQIRSQILPFETTALFCKLHPISNL